MVSDFAEIKQDCLKNNKLWEDTDFSAVQESVFYHQTPPFAFEWKRPKEFGTSISFIAPQGKIHPGQFGDHWLASCFGCLRQVEGLFYRVVPADQSFDEDYCGIFRFRIWWHGEWREVCVDDRLPVVGNKLVFMNDLSAPLSQFWPSLLEKAYAKLHGSYEALKYGTFGDALSDLTGGVAENIQIDKNLNQTLSWLENCLRMTSIVTCKIIIEGAKKAEEALHHGFFPNESYKILEVHKGPQADDVVLTLRPSTSLHKYNQGLIVDSQGNIKLSLAKWTRIFTHLDVIHLDKETAADEPSLKSRRPWNVRVFQGYWRRGVNAGGCRNYDSFHINPRLQITNLSDGYLVISVSQYNVTEPQVIGFTGYEITDEIHTDSTDPKFYKTRKSLINSQYTNARQVTERALFNSGVYLVLPTTFEPGSEAQFIFRIYSQQPVKLKQQEVAPVMLKTPWVTAKDAQKSLSQYQGIFLKIADQQKSVNPFELQELLEICLPNDYIKSCATVDICRQVVKVFDEDHVGRLNFQEFKNLICSIKLWQSVFKNHTKEKTGALKVERFKDALEELGFRLNSSILSNLVFKYIRKDGTLRFGDFVGAVLSLTSVFEFVGKKGDDSTLGFLKLATTELLELAI